MRNIYVNQYLVHSPIEMNNLIKLKEKLYIKSGKHLIFYSLATLKTLERLLASTLFVQGMKRKCIPSPMKTGFTFTAKPINRYSCQQHLGIYKRCPFYGNVFIRFQCLFSFQEVLSHSIICNFWPLKNLPLCLLKQSVFPNRFCTDPGPSSGSTNLICLSKETENRLFVCNEVYK